MPRMAMLFAACFAFSFVGAAQTCVPGIAKIPVRVTLICPEKDLEANNKGTGCKYPLRETEVREALTRANIFLPVCLQLFGSIREDESMSNRASAWKISDDEYTLSHRPAPSWSILDVFVIDAFAKDSSTPGFIAGRVGEVAYALRTDKRKKDVKLAKVRLDRDGLIIRRDRLARSSTLPHETAHWLGLLHTFQGCDDFGDDIDDTAAQSVHDKNLQQMGNRDGKAVSYLDDDKCSMMQVLTIIKAYEKTECGVKISMKDLHNLMGYTQCRNELTPMQQKVILDVWNRRAKLGDSVKVYP
jgi:Pregnancy-associated plasma protein-A